MRGKTFIFIILILNIFLITPLYGMTIIDTGIPESHYGLALRQSQWLAGEFYIEKESIITEIDGWLVNVGSLSNSITVAVYTDGGGVPADKLYSQVYGDVGPMGTTAWFGPSGLNWHLNSGYYWVAFEVHDDKFDGGMPGRAPHPLISYAIKGVYQPDSYIQYHDENDDEKFAVRIMGDQVPFPPPSSCSAVASWAWWAGGGLGRFDASDKAKTAERR